MGVLGLSACGGAEARPAADEDDGGPSLPRPPGSTGGPRDAGEDDGRRALPPTLAPTFSAIYREVFVPSNCTLGLCHGEGARGGGLDLYPREDAHAALVGVPSASRGCGGEVLVEPHDAEASLLVRKLVLPPPCGAPMPPDEPLLPEQVDQIRAWIALGAPND
jgi:hypothetical protein